MDQEYGNVTGCHVADLQRDMGLEPDGHLGPQTRRSIKAAFGFDFDAACQTVPGMTKFVQPDGSIIEWSPNDE